MFLMNIQHPVTWAADLDNNRFIGHMILKKSQGDTMTPQDSSAILGLQVKGGKMKEAGKLGAFISKVKRGSIADTVGHLRAGMYKNATMFLGVVDLAAKFFFVLSVGLPLITQWPNFKELLISKKNS